MKHTFIALALTLASAASFAGTLWVSEEGEQIVVPDNKKIVLVPKSWKPNQLVYVVGGKVHEPESVTTTEIPEECEGYGELVVSPTVIPAYCAQYFD